MTDPEGGHRRATMKDVAALAGVGLSTVSRVVANRPGVKAEKVRKVEAAIAELNFTRNDFARTLRTGSAGTIGVVVTRLADPFYAQLAHAVEERAGAEDMLVLIASASDDPTEAERVLQRIVRRRLDGLVVVVPEGADVRFLQSEIEGGTPVVLVDRPAAGVHSDEVVADNVNGMVAAVDHLVAAGHTRIACIVHTSGAFTADARRSGFVAGLKKHGIAYDESLVLTLAESAEVIAPALSELLASADAPTALVTTNGPMSKETLRAMRALDITLPLVGFDDLDDADLWAHPITAIAQDPVAMGEKAADLLIARIRGLEGPRQRIVLGTHLIAR